jgi:transposase
MMEIEKPMKRKRVHSEEFRAGLVRACSEPGVSVAGIALANGVNANLLRKWMKARGVTIPNRRPKQAIHQPLGVAEFVPVAMAPAKPSLPEIRIEARRGDAVVKVDWPVAAAGACATWLRDWLR